MAVFKPTPLSWEDVEGGEGQDVLYEIDQFVGEYCFPETPLQFRDEELVNDLAFFGEAWQGLRFDTGRSAVADQKQMVALLALIHGAFYSSYAADELKGKLANSATKMQLVEMLTHVSSLFCQYISLRARIENGGTL